MRTIGYTESTMLAALTITIVILVFVGRYIAAQGIVFIKRAWDETTAQRINKSLLLGFYLVNIGYAGWQMTDWPRINFLDQAILNICSYCGKILLLVGILHYINIITIQYFINKNI